MWSESGDGIDYYFLYGPEIDDVIGGYRTLTGRASMLPDWAFGFWQSKNKYNTQDEILSTLAELRRRQIPDRHASCRTGSTWPPDRWGDHEFEASRYPDPAAMIEAIHAQHARFMVSVWGKFYPVTENYKALEAIDGLYLHDHHGPHAGLAQSRIRLLRRLQRAGAQDVLGAGESRAIQERRGRVVDGRDGARRRAAVAANARSAAAGHRSHGDGNRRRRVMNAYPLMNSEAVYDGQRSAAPDQRVFILTRSGFAGIQRYATVTWSGDITSTFQTLRKQIAAGLGFSISGTPYWTTRHGRLHDGAAAGQDSRTARRSTNGGS